VTLSYRPSLTRYRSALRGVGKGGLATDRWPIIAAICRTLLGMCLFAAMALGHLSTTYSLWLSNRRTGRRRRHIHIARGDISTALHARTLRSPLPSQISPLRKPSMRTTSPRRFEHAPVPRGTDMLPAAIRPHWRGAARGNERWADRGRARGTQYNLLLPPYLSYPGALFAQPHCHHPRFNLHTCNPYPCRHLIFPHYLTGNTHLRATTPNGTASGGFAHQPARLRVYLRGSIPAASAYSGIAP